MSVFYKLAILIIFSSFVLQDQYPLKYGKPTTKGIELYVKNNKFKIISEVEKSINDTIFLDVEIIADDIRTYTDYDSLDLGFHITYQDGSDEIIIDNQPTYAAYDIETISSIKKLFLTTFNGFVKTVIIHELIHTYFLQTVLELKFNGLELYPEYDEVNNFTIFPNIEIQFGAEFIEEGVCQYVVNKMNQTIKEPPFFIETINDITKKKNTYQVKYNYSYYFLKDFLDSMELKEGIIILIQNKPPTYKEILNPDLYFNRLNI
jgi:hypothetical protein